MQQKKVVGEVRREFEGVSLGDRRIDARAVEIVERLAASPDDSFPEQMTSDAELEGLYRFFANRRVTMAGLLAPHVRATCERMHRHKFVRIVHDTTSLQFDGEREGLGILMGKAKGFFAHTSLAISGDEAREPLGVLAMEPFIHKDTVARRKLTPNERIKETKSTPREKRESHRWEKQALAVQTVIPASTHAIHVMDQEGDDFYVFDELLSNDCSFVIRIKGTRTTSEKLPVSVVMGRQPAKLFRSVRLTERKSLRNVKRHPPRPEREAVLELRWAPLELRRPKRLGAAVRKTAALNVVHVFEPNPPAGQQPIEWMLVTNEPVQTDANATAIVDHYRARWMIEEYFKALKTGCAVEKRQLTTFDGLTKALALFVPIAWSLLVLRHLSRVEPMRPAASIFDRDELLLLRALLEQRGQKLAGTPSVRDVMLAIARLGGHIRNNGDPGWIVLGRGYLRFSEAKIVWNIARKYDQS